MAETKCPYSKIMIEPFKNEEVTSGGIILPHANKRPTRRGRAVSVGPDCKYVGEGDSVLFDEAKACWDAIPEEGSDTNVTFAFVNEEDILAYSKS